MQFSIIPCDPVEEALGPDLSSNVNNKAEKLKINKFQSEFIEKCKNAIKLEKIVPINFDLRSERALTINPYRDTPDISKYGYVKMVMAMIPHANFPGIELRCAKEGCRHSLSPKNFGSTRLCHGFHEDFYILTYNYIFKECKTLQCSSVLKLDDYFSKQYGIYFNRKYV